MPYSGYLLGYGTKNPPPLLAISFAPGVAASAVPTAGQWVDITSRVSTMDIRYGRTDEFSQPSAGSMELVLNNADGAMDPDNASGPYAGQLLPLVWFRARGGVTTVNTDLFYGQVSIEGWRIQASQYSDSFVSVTVLDMFEQMANTYLPSSVYALEVDADNPRAWYRLGEGSGTVATDSSGNGHHGTYEGGATFNSRLSLIAEEPDNSIEFDGVDDIAVMPGSAGFSGNQWTVEMWVAMSENTTANDWVLWEQQSSVNDDYWLLAVSGTNAPDVGELFLQSKLDGTTRLTVGTTRVDDGRTHHIVFTRAATGAVQVYVDKVLDMSATFGTTAHPVAKLQLAYGDARVGGANIAGTRRYAGTMDEVALYDTVLSSARIAAHHAAGTEPWKGDSTDQRINKLLDAVDFPVGQRYIEVGASTVRRTGLNTDLLTALQEVTAAERGELYIDHANGGKVRFRGRRARWTNTAGTESTTVQVTFGDGGGTEVPVTAMGVEDARIVNHAAVQRFNGSTITANDTASETQYQRRSHAETGLMIETDAEARSRADLIVAEKKDRQRRVRAVTLEPRASTHPAWPQVFARRIGDRVAVRWRPPYGGTYTFTSWVEGVHHNYTAAGRALRTTLDLSPVPYGGVAGETTYWIVGESRVGVDTRPGY